MRLTRLSTTALTKYINIITLLIKLFNMLGLCHWCKSILEHIDKHTSIFALKFLMVSKAFLTQTYQHSEFFNCLKTVKRPFISVLLNK